MYTARYKTDDINTDIEAKDITRKQYEETYKDNLFCEYDDCNAEIVFNERQKGNFLRYFSTKPGSQHRPGCPNEIFHKGTRPPVIRVQGNDVNVSDKHVSETLSDAYKNFYNKLFQIDTSTKPKSKGKPSSKNVKKPNDNEQPTTSIISTPTANGGETIIEGKEPYIYKREISDITNEDKNSCKEVHGLVEGMRIYEDEAFIDLKGLDGTQFSAYMGTPFKTLHEQEFNLLHILNSYIVKEKSKNHPVIFTSFGEIMEMKDKPVIQLYNYRHLKLNNLGLYNIINLLQ